MTLPGGSTALKAVAQPPVRFRRLRPCGRCIHRSGSRRDRLRGLAQVYDSLGDMTAAPGLPPAFGAAVDWRGQVITMLDRAYLAESMPSLIVWGEQDTVIPVKHAYAAHAVLPGSQLEIIRTPGTSRTRTTRAFLRPRSSTSSSTPNLPRTTAAAGWKALANGPRPRKFWASAS